MQQAITPRARRQLLLEATHAAVALSDIAQLAEQVVSKIARAFSTSVALIYRVKEDGNVDIFTPATMVQTLCAMREYGPYAALDPYVEVKERFNPKLAIISELVDRKRLRHSPVDSVLRRHDADQLLVASLSDVAYGLAGSMGIFLGRSRRQRGFDRTQLTDLEQIQPILVAAIARNIHLAKIKREREALAGTLAHLQSGALIAFEIDGRMLWMSPEAEALLGDHVAPANLSEAAARVGAFQRGDVPPKALVPLSFRYDAAPEKSITAALQLSYAGAGEQPIVLAHLSCSTVADRWLDGMPPRLRRVLDLLLTGLGEKEIAARAGLSYATTHQYVVEIYRRAGVSSRAQLMAHALNQK